MDFTELELIFFFDDLRKLSERSYPCSSDSFQWTKEDSLISILSFAHTYADRLQEFKDKYNYNNKNKCLERTLLSEAKLISYEAATEIIRILPQTDLICELKGILGFQFKIFLSNQLNLEITNEDLDKFIKKCVDLKSSVESYQLTKGKNETV